MGKLAKFTKLSSADKRLYVEAILISTTIKLMINCFPFRWYAPYLGKQHLVTSDDNIEHSYPVIFRISQAIVRSQKTVPWQNKCLVNAITAKIMLRKRGLQATLYLGVNKKNEEMAAHAWLRCGSFFVTGKREMGKFTVVDTFA